MRISFRFAIGEQLGTTSVFPTETTRKSLVNPSLKLN
jgi:hypothetical protein